MRRQHFAAVEFILYLSIFDKVIGTSDDKTRKQLETELKTPLTDSSAALSMPVTIAACKVEGPGITN